MRSGRISILVAMFLVAGVSASAQIRILPLGDSITQGGQGFASYRYPLYFDLLADGYSVDFVGARDFLNGGGAPNPADYPDYGTTFDRDHEGYWGYRTDQIEVLVQQAAMVAQPDVVLLHLGTNDIGQNGAAGVIAADTNLRDIIALIRIEVPNVTILLSRIIPIGAGSGYGTNAAQVGPLNAVIDSVALAMDTVQSPVVVVDPNSSFSLATMMQADGLHPNLLGEQHIADGWRAALAMILIPGNLPPTIELTAPVSGSAYSEPGAVAIAATASDSDGTVDEVRFYANNVWIGSDTTAPHTLDWFSVAAGNYSITAEAEDNDGAIQTSAAVGILVSPFGAPVSIAVANSSFEEPPRADSEIEGDSALIPDWDFVGTANTFLGIFNPPSGSYPEAAAQGTPVGADGAQVAFLFNNGGPSESVVATQLLQEGLVAGRSYTLSVAIGRFDPSQPYTPSSYGGYTIELLAGNSVIASDSDSFTPPALEFADAVAFASAETIDPLLVGEVLSIRLRISATEAQRSTHFDDVRLTWTAPASVPFLGVAAIGVLTAMLMIVVVRESQRRQL